MSRMSESCRKSFFLLLVLSFLFGFPPIAYSNNTTLRTPATGTSKDGAARILDALRDDRAADGAGKTFTASVNGLLASVSGVLEVTPTEVRVLNEETLRTKTIFDLKREASLNPNNDVKVAAQRIIREAGISLGIKEASLHYFYMARHEGKWDNFTSPSYNVRTNAFQTMRQIYRAMNEDDAKAFGIELARSERRYTGQLFPEYTAMAYAAAIAEGYRGPLFVQGDHFQVDKK
ncbi:MAG: hypothetical protein ABH845_03250, partial [Candidatus Omnitrophota bacterium]